MHNHFGTLRQRLVDCRATYRQTKDLYEQAAAQAEQVAYQAGKVTGKNKEQRDTELVLALMGDPSYQAAKSALRDVETAVERAEATLEAAKDARRASEWQIRQQLADGLFRAGVASDNVDDEAFDDTADQLALHYAEEAARDIVQGQTEEDVAWQIHTGTYDAGAEQEEQEIPF